MEIYKKLIKVQEAIGKLQRDAVGQVQSRKYNYLTLTELNEHLLPLLHKEKLMLIQPIFDSIIVTKIINSEKPDESIESSLEIPQGLTPQQTGSAITYFRRYTILSLLNISTEDDDGAVAEKKAPVKQQPMTSNPDYDWRGLTPLEEIPEEEREWINQYTTKDGITNTKAFLRAVELIKEGYNIHELRLRSKINRDVAKAIETTAKTQTA